MKESLKSFLNSTVAQLKRFREPTSWASKNWAGTSHKLPKVSENNSAARGQPSILFHWHNYPKTLSIVTLLVFWPLTGVKNPSLNLRASRQLWRRPPTKKTTPPREFFDLAKMRPSTTTTPSKFPNFAGKIVFIRH